MHSSTSSNSRVIIAGATSIHGWALARIPHPITRVPVCNTHVRGHFCKEWDRVDAEDTDGWLCVLERHEATALIYCAGVCHVEQCEKHPDWARRINVDSVVGLMERLPDTIRFVYVSSDHVFAGREHPYFESDTPDPISHYGRLRVEAEQRLLSLRPDALVLRPGLCIGPTPAGPRGHWNSLAHRLQRNRPVTIIEGEFRTAVWAEDAAERILEWTVSSRAGIYHITATRPASRPELAQSICRARHLPATYTIQHRTTLNKPHLGRVELGSIHGEAPLMALPDRLKGLN